MSARLVSAWLLSVLLALACLLPTPQATAGTGAATSPAQPFTRHLLSHDPLTHDTCPAEPVCNGCGDQPADTFSDSPDIDGKLRAAYRPPPPKRALHTLHQGYLVLQPAGTAVAVHARDPPVSNSSRF